MQVSMYIEHGTVILVPSCYLPCAEMRRRFPDATYACMLVVADDPNDEWAALLHAMEQETFATMSLAKAIVLLGAPTHALRRRPGAATSQRADTAG